MSWAHEELRTIALGDRRLDALLAVQRAVAWGRMTPAFSTLVDNEPRILMRGAVIDEDSSKASRVTRADVFATLREANVTELSQVLAVVLESTGDISVLHGRASDRLEDALYEAIPSR